MRKVSQLLTASAIVVIVIVIASWGLMNFYPSLSDRASFGDSFGGINALFSGLAFAGIIYTILLQMKELELQRQELAETRVELKRTADAQKESLEIVKTENRIKYLPYLNPGIRKFPLGKTVLSINNESNNPAFDLDIWLFYNLVDSFESKEMLIEHHVKEKYAAIHDPTHLLDGDIYAVYDRGIFPHLQSAYMIEVPLEKLPGPLIIDVVLQYRDVLDNNYVQKASFSIKSEEENASAILEVFPKLPVISERLDFLNERRELSERKIQEYQEQFPRELKHLFSLFAVSIPLGHLKGDRTLGVECKWDTKKIGRNDIEVNLL